jgi:hypothetical protein
MVIYWWRKEAVRGRNIVINWWKNKKYLAISGEKASDIVCRLTTLFTDTYIFDDHCTAAVDVENPINNNCSCLRVESTVETECIKKKLQCCGSRKCYNQPKYDKYWRPNMPL